MQHTGSLAHVALQPRLGVAPALLPSLQLERTRWVVAAAARRQLQKKRKGNKQSNGSFDLVPDLDDYDVVTSTGAPVLPKAPPPADARQQQPEDVAYKVFAPKLQAVQQARQPWQWDEPEDATTSGPPIPHWNPRTGFMPTQPPPLPPPTPGGASSSKGSQGMQGAQQQQQYQQQQQPAATAHIDLLSPSVIVTDTPLPAVTQAQVMTACVGTTFWMTALAFIIKAYAQANAPSVLGTDPVLLGELVAIPSGLGSWANAGVLVAAAGAVTGARFALQDSWPEFRQAMDVSNKQVLSPLNWWDVVLVAVMTGVSEELLFRGALLPATFLDWRGVLISGAIFGALHTNGGRNAAFAAWAGAVGCLYGAAFLATHNIWVPAGAHALANFAAAAAWKTRRAGWR